MRSVSTSAKAATAPTQIQAFVAVAQARSASTAAGFIRARMAARAAPLRSAVTSGSATVALEVNRKTGLSARSATASRPCLGLGASP